MRVPAPGRPTKERGSAQPSAAGCQTPGPGAHQGLTPQALALSGRLGEMVYMQILGPCTPEIKS